MNRSCIPRGFTALIAVLLLSLGTLGMSLSALGAAALYADNVRAREVRIQTSLNKEACKEAALMSAQRNPFLEGELRVREFGCTAKINRNGSLLLVEVAEGPRLEY